MQEQLNTLTQQVHTLRRSLLRWQLGTAAAVLLLVGVSAVRPEPQMVRARMFVLEDEAGSTVGLWTTNKGSTGFMMDGVSVTSSADAAQVAIGVGSGLNEDRSGALAVLKADRDKREGFTQSVLLLRTEDQPKNKSLVSVSCSAKGQPGMMIFDKSGELVSGLTTERVLAKQFDTGN